MDRVAIVEAFAASTCRAAAATGRAGMRGVVCALLCLVVAGDALAQTASPKPAPRKPVARPTPKPSPAPTPTPVPMGEEFLALIRTTVQKDPEAEASRQLLLARIAHHLGQPEEARRRLDEAEQGILALPKTSGFDSKSINFRRMFTWWSWIGHAMKVDPERGLKAVKPFTEDSNPNYSGALLASVARDVDCAQPAQKASLEGAGAEAFESGKTMIRLDREAWAVNSWKAAVRADLRCGSYARAAQVAPLIDSVIKKRRKQRLECGHLELRAWARLPQVERAVASFSEDVATDYSNRVDVCESERLAFAAELVEWAPPGESQAAVVVAFVDQAVADLKPLQPGPPADAGKAP
ncbi:MAG TPA: hypothetical protein VLI67_06260, partial [Vicinamibacteria bacterium]|nr:hypothetical protein [Vicinamibacteria bacterium]